MQIKMIAKR